MKLNYTVVENMKLTDCLFVNLGLNKSVIKKLLADKEIKINGKRVCDNLDLTERDNIEIFVPLALMPKYERAYEDDNILVVDKPPHLEVYPALTNLLKNEYGYIVPVHRLDINTRGLIVFAKNSETEEILKVSFKNRSIEKKYQALVYGQPAEGTFKAYLFKDANKNICYVSDKNREGYREIITGIDIIETLRINSHSISLVTLTLVTGRTHQLRAHLSHLNCPILGDDKYGNYTVNKLLNKRIQMLVAKSIEFNSLPPPLDYLNKCKIEIPCDLLGELK